MKIEIDYKPKIFDHPDYCNNEAYGCDFVSFSSHCHLFGSQLEKDHIYIKKCDQCKIHHEKAKK